MSSPPGPASRNPGRPATVKQTLQRPWRWLSGLVSLVLVWHALEGVAWVDLGHLLAGISPWAIPAIAGVNLLLIPLMTARWWLLLRILGSPVGLTSLCGYRTAASAVSYLTPGPHFGGEPLSIYLLHHRNGIALSTASTSVVVDRLLELLASFGVLMLCLLYLAWADIVLFTGPGRPVLIIVVLVITAGTLWAILTGRQPFSRSVSLLRNVCPRIPWINGTLTKIIAQSETMAASLFQNHGCRFLLAGLLSLGHWVGVFAEFWLMSVFLGRPMSFWQLTAVVMTARLAFFTPLPAGIGVLESALPWVTAALGMGSPLGLGLCLIIRCRDIIFSLLGLGLTTKYLTCPSKVGIIRRESTGTISNNSLK